MIITLEEMKDFLGESETSSDGVITDLIESAEEELATTTGLDLASGQMEKIIKKAIRIMVWLSFYAERDASKNTEYLVRERTRLIQILKWSDKHEETSS